MHVGQRGSCPFPTHLTTKEEIDRYEERLVTTLDKLKANEFELSLVLYGVERHTS